MFVGLSLGRRTLSFAYTTGLALCAKPVWGRALWPCPNCVGAVLRQLRIPAVSLELPTHPSDRVVLMPCHVVTRIGAIVWGGSAHHAPRLGTKSRGPASSHVTESWAAYKT